MVEHPAVNRRVASSSLARGADITPKPQSGFLIYMSYYVYILESETSGSYYVGSSENPEKRLQFHNTLEKGFTSRYRPWRIIFKKEYESKMEALGSERKIKSWKNRKMIERVISGEIKL